MTLQIEVRAFKDPAPFMGAGFIWLVGLNRDLTQQRRRLRAVPVR